jgi:sugar phosphate isomerase/epimerase
MGHTARLTLSEKQAICYYFSPIPLHLIIKTHDFMRSLAIWITLCLITAGLFSCSAPPAPTAQALGWEIGPQAYTFRNFTFFEAVDKAKSLGLHYIEAYPGQLIGGGLKGKMSYTMDSATGGQILDYLKKQDVKMLSYGVIVPDSPAQWDSLFVWAKTMGLENIVSEPHLDQMSYISQLCDQYGINVAIHNHPLPSHYWSPDTLLAAIQGQSPRIGSCADVGHWKRSGLDPVACLKKLEGHIIELHFKDIASASPEAEDTVWGTGVCDLDAMVQELHRQQFKGLFSIEYEADPENNIPQIQQSLKNFDQAVAGLR